MFILKDNEKETPKSVNGFYGDWGCPTCDRTIEKEKEKCPYCGQKLKDFFDDKEIR
jgi:rubrerythrin